MLDTMTFTKALGAVCGALLIYLLGKWAGEELFFVGSHYGDGAQAYVIETGSDEPEEEVAEASFEELYASADASAGERVWGQCRACHQLTEGSNAVGPYLYGVVGRDIGVASGYGNYSGALSEAADVWTPDNLNAFLENPSGWAPGTSMSYRGLSSAEDRANLIAFLDQTDE